MRPDGTRALPEYGAARRVPLRRPAAFLDRDGVINIDHGYTFRTSDLVFTPTAIEGIRLLNEADYLVIVVTNQSGVARGLYRTGDVERFHEHLQERLKGAGAHVDAFYYCAFHPDGTIAEFAREHEDRKPSPGMLRRAMHDWPIRNEGSFLIGDKPSDMEVAARAGLPGIAVLPNVCDLAAEVRAAIAAHAPPAAA